MRERLERAAREHAASPPRRPAHGRPGRRAGRAQRRSSTCCVTGSRGYGPLRSVITGGVSGRVIRSAQLPGDRRPARRGGRASGRGVRDRGAQRRPAARGGLDVERPAHEREPLAHPDEPEPGGAPVRRRSPCRRRAPAPRSRSPASRTTTATCVAARAWRRWSAPPGRGGRSSTRARPPAGPPARRAARPRPPPARRATPARARSPSSSSAGGPQVGDQRRAGRRCRS